MAFNEINIKNGTSLNLVEYTFGCMTSYALCTCGIAPDEFMKLFLASGIAEQLEWANPKYVVGMSGMELAELVFSKTGYVKESETAPYCVEDKGPEFWAGELLAWCQRRLGVRFEDILEKGMLLSEILALDVVQKSRDNKFMDILGVGLQFEKTMAEKMGRKEEE